MVLFLEAQVVLLGEAVVIGYLCCKGVRTMLYGLKEVVSFHVLGRLLSNRVTRLDSILKNLDMLPPLELVQICQGLSHKLGGGMLGVVFVQLKQKPNVFSCPMGHKLHLQAFQLLLSLLSFEDYSGGPTLEHALQHCISSD